MIDIIRIDSEITLVLSTAPPAGPGESEMIEYHDNTPFE
jgi:hypothetical protein